MKIRVSGLNLTFHCAKCVARDVGRKLFVDYLKESRDVDSLWGKTNDTPDFISEVAGLVFFF